MDFSFGFNDFRIDAVIVKLVSVWNENSGNKMGRTTLQKLCYFAKAIDVPLGYRFRVHQYGPYSRELYEHIDDMVSYGLLNDEHAINEQKPDTSSYSIGEYAADLLDTYKDEVSKQEDKIIFLINYFKSMPITKLELYSTTHYYYAANKGFYRDINEDELLLKTIEKVLEVKKDKFSRDEVHDAYCTLLKTPQFS